MRRNSKELGTWITGIRGVMRAILFLLCLTATVLCHAETYAAAGNLDSTFNSPNGFHQYSFPLGSNTILHDIAYQPDGKIVAAGETVVSGYFYMLLVRFNGDGTVDSSFGTGGYTLSHSAKGFGVALQQDGKIVVAGQKQLGGGISKIILWRYDSNGTTDTGFGTNGSAVFEAGADGEESGARVALQADGKIVVAGSSTYNQLSVGRVLRYTSSGTLDASFGTGGSTYFSYAMFNISVYLSDLAFQPDGKILLGGGSVSASEATVMVMRLNSNGTLDSGFGTSGLVIYSGPASDVAASALALQADGKIVIGGYSGSGILLLRLNNNGSTDSTFGTAGAVLYASGGAFRLHDIAIQNNGKIAAAGRAHPPVLNETVTVWRFNGNGTIDTGFGTGGVVSYSSTNVVGYEAAHAVLIQPDGRIVAAGAYYVGAGSTGGFIMRLLPQYYDIATPTVPTSGCNGFTSCSPDPVWEGGSSQCAIIPNSGCYTEGLRLLRGMVSLTVNPVWSYPVDYVTSDVTLEATFALGSIWLFKKNFQFTEVLMETDTTLALAFSDTALNSYDLIRMPSGAFYYAGGADCSDIGSVVPVLSGGWTTSELRGSVPTVIAHRFTISGTCALIIDGITIQ